jgi:hypothetical protein
MDRALLIAISDNGISHGFADTLDFHEFLAAGPVNVNFLLDCHSSASVYGITVTVSDRWSDDEPQGGSSQ